MTGHRRSDGFRAPPRILINVDRFDFDDFARAIRGADHEVDLFGAAMIVSRLGGHPIDPFHTAARLDHIAEDVLKQAGPNPTQDALSHAIEHQLFTVEGFHGNTTNYPDPANSYLDLVVEQRTGIPITLSLVYMEVAQRVGLICDGVGYPKHFIIRYGGPENPVYVDPFQQGARIDRQELIAGLRTLKSDVAHPDTYLTAVTRRQILQRLLNNLHTLFRERRDLESWYAVIELQLRLEPWNAAFIGERGMLHYRLGRLAEALDDLETYVTAGDKPVTSPGAIRLLDHLRLRRGGSENSP